MKVLQINNYHYLRGGSETVYLETSQLLEDNGHKVIHFSVSDVESLDSKTKKYFVKPHHYMGGSLLDRLFSIPKFLYSNEASTKLDLLLSKEKPDIVHLHIFYARLTSSILPVLKKHNVPVVMTLHEHRLMCPTSLFMDSENNICEKCANGNYLHCIKKRCNKGSLPFSIISALEAKFRDLFFPYENYINSFIAVSDFSLNKHSQYKGWSTSKLSRIYNFVDINKYHFVNNHKDRSQYLYFGRLSKEKGILTLFRAWTNFPDLELIVVGEGDQRAELEQFIVEHKITNITLTGFLSGSELKERVVNSKFVILPSECYENNPLTVIESFAYGVPVIGANIGGIPELILDCNLLFNSRDEASLVKAIIYSQGLSYSSYKIISEDVRNFVEDYCNAGAYYNQLINIYSNLLTLSHEK